MMLPALTPAAPVLTPIPKPADKTQPAAGVWPLDKHTYSQASRKASRDGLIRRIKDFIFNS